MKHLIIGTLHFSRKERLGVVALFALCIAVFALPELIRHFYPRKKTDFSQFQADVQAFRQAMQAGGIPAGKPFAFDPNTATFDDFVQLGLSEKVANHICNYRNKGGRFREPTDFQKIWSLSKEDFGRLLPYIRIESPENEAVETGPVGEKSELFAFDPNIATEEEFLRLGLPKGTVRSILNYRIKGGYFKNKADFKKIYTLDDQDYLRLEPYIRMDAVAATEAPRPVAYSGSASNAVSKFAANTRLDVNRAGLEDWQGLPGIGEKRAQQIVKFRESLGGFLSVEQLAEMYGLPDSVFQRIRPMLEMAPTGVRQINLNAASAEDLEAHPYISGKQAKLIVAYREQHGAFASADDLAKIQVFSDKKWLEKVRPYLSVR